MHFNGTIFATALSAMSFELRLIQTELPCARFTSRHAPILPATGSPQPAGFAFAAVMPTSRAATIQVTTPDDAGTTSTCTLRQAIAAMNAKALGSSSSCANLGSAFGFGDTITFASTVTSVDLADAPNNELLITDYSLTIQGTGTGGRDRVPRSAVRRTRSAFSTIKAPTGIWRD